jgi:phosphotransferase system HPr (HPr) family protein
MIAEELTITNRLGLHARAAAQLVRCAGRFSATVRLERVDGSASADAKSILSVLMLAATRGTLLRIIIEGDDETEAFDAIAQLFRAGFGDNVQ